MNNRTVISNRTNRPSSRPFGPTNLRRPSNPKSLPNRSSGAWVGISGKSRSGNGWPVGDLSGSSLGNSGSSLVSLLFLSVVTLADVLGAFVVVFGSAVVDRLVDVLVIVFSRGA